MSPFFKVRLLDVPKVHLREPPLVTESALPGLVGSERPVGCCPPLARRACQERGRAPVTGGPKRFPRNTDSTDSPVRALSPKATKAQTSYWKRQRRDSGPERGLRRRQQGGPRADLSETLLFGLGFALLSALGGWPQLRGTGQVAQHFGVAGDAECAGAERPPPQAGGAAAETKPGSPAAAAAAPGGAGQIAPPHRPGLPPLPRPSRDVGVVPSVHGDFPLCVQIPRTFRSPQQVSRDPAPRATPFPRSLPSLRQF